MPVRGKNHNSHRDLPPGSPPYTTATLPQVTITAFDYDSDSLAVKTIHNIAECLPFQESTACTWVRVQGALQPEALAELGKLFAIHPLVLQNIIHADQRSKIEIHDTYLFIILKHLRINHKTSAMERDQVSLIMGKNFLLSFEPEASDIFDSVKLSLESNDARLRKMGADYLGYALINVIIDNYYNLMEQIGDKIEGLQEIVVKTASPEVAQNINNLKKEALFLRKAVWPLREVLSSLSREALPFVADSTRIYYRDAYDHIVQIIDMVEVLREMSSDLVDIYLSSINNRLSEVMKVLTIISTIFIPLTFIAGLYGMNFVYMPELKSPWGYPVVLLVMATIAMVMLIFFRRKKWF
jgi:magnesium transporter